MRPRNWNENNLNPLTRIYWRASLVPAAAVIPAPIAYIKVVAVKKLVVESQFLVVYGPLCSGYCSTELNNNTGLFCWYRFVGWAVGFRPDSTPSISLPSNAHSALNRALCGDRYVYFEKIRVLKAGVQIGPKRP